MTFEETYGFVMKYVFKGIDPIKRSIMTTSCQVHIFNNEQALRVLKDFGYDDAYTFYYPMMESFNEGSVWADQNFKSSNHFYNPKTHRGLFGHSHSLQLAKDYYKLALSHFKAGRLPSAMFYLGACTHIIQDLTIPQHVNVKLLDHHRQFENFVKYTYDLVKEYRSKEPPILFGKIGSYVEFNARVALKLDKAYGKVQPLKMRYFKITLSSLPLAQSTTAGAMLLFLTDCVKASVVASEEKPVLK